MSKLSLDQFKTETKNRNLKATRLTLDQFKSDSLNQKNEELEKLTGGILGACHVPPKKTSSSAMDVIDNIIDYFTPFR